MSFQTYDDTVPATANNPSQDQPIMLLNAVAIQNIWLSDHRGFNDNFGGFHDQVHMFNQSAPGLSGADGVLYANNPISASFPLWQNVNGSYQIIGANANSDAGFASFSGYGAFGTVTTNYQQSAGWTYLPGGMILQYGSVTSTRGTPQIDPSTIAVTFPVVYTSSNPIITITPICKSGGTSQSDTASVQQGTVSGSGFTCNFNTSTTAYIGFTWTSIGK